uniref:succinate dehydrogenase subunit 3 n=1 Tax=Caulacanthus ustulatus TaxID=31411 RepID=UPI0030027449|nr:succinate dehydrogenase subunit 3 [Caulacanthus ustulatus]
MKTSLYFSNRPISPHVFIYEPQISSLGSIWHRISGILLTIIIFFFVFLIKMTLVSPIFFCTLSIMSWIQLFFYKLILLSFAYHALNGFRYIIYHLKFLPNYNKFTWPFNIIILLVFLVLIVNI